MPEGKFTQCSRKDFIRKLRKLGFSILEGGGKHGKMRYGSYTQIIPNNYNFSIEQLKDLLKQVENGLDRKGKPITSDEWINL